jgi:hypothetical protein
MSHAEQINQPIIDALAASTVSKAWDPTMYDRGLQAFERDLPELMKTHHRQWVIYHGERRFGPSESYEVLDLDCQNEGVVLGERVCRVIEPDVILDVTG